MAGQRPIVGIPCDWRLMGAHGFQMVGEKYIIAVREGAGALPLLVPVLDPPLEGKEILAAVDGLLLTGSPSNVAPRRYGGAPPRDGVMQDERRDETSLALIREAVAQGVPTLCVCRGFQELNVAFGGTLHQHVAEVEGRSDHREDKKAPIEVQYGPSHDVAVSEGGLLAEIVRERTFKVNSLHSQGIDRLAPPLRADAKAPDGLIEAVSIPGAKGFLLGLQWHPEWRWEENPVSRAVFIAFGNAALVARKRRQLIDNDVSTHLP